jgi:nucleotide-binding universal stress UspA family protein
MHTCRIVVGFDGSEGGARALSWAVGEAAQRGGTVQAVTAWQWTDPALGLDVRAEHDRMARLSLTEAIKGAVADHPEVPVAGDAVPGRPAEVLTRAAAGADLLVLGSHGHGRLFHAVLGSVAEECVRAAVCPVVVVPVPHEVTEPAETAAPVTTATY